MSVRDVIQAFRDIPEFSSHITHIETIPAREAIYRAVSRPFPEKIERYLESQGISLYCHQSEARDALQRGEDIILTTSTASGKTLAFSLPVFEMLDNNQDARALYIYPTKALSNDQLKSLLGIERLTEIIARPAVYDGDTPKDRRQIIRTGSRIIISNPYELHCILPWHHQWSEFFKNLCVVVIDEAHQYRGVHGSNVAFLMRRLRRICRHYGKDPAFILSSATIANPGDFAAKLTGKPVTCISNDGSPRGLKHFVLYNPFTDGDMSRATYRESGKILRMCLDHNVRMLCFTGSRKLTELITLHVKDYLLNNMGRDPAMVSAYRAGYLPEERRVIEDGMKTGVLKGIVSTNALELGIDIGLLDGVIMTGFPGSIMSTWQQAGRAGRTREESLAIMVAYPDPLDQYFMKHPDIFFGSCHERAIIDLENPYILSSQVLCAAAELPVKTDTDTQYFGNNLEPLLDSLHREQLVSRTRRGWIYSGTKRPVELAGISNITNDQFRVVCTGQTIETMDRSQAFREAHKGAVLYHQGEKYLVLSMDTDRHIIRVEPTDVDYYTRPLQSVGVEIISEQNSRKSGNIRISFGEVQVTEHCTAYRVMKYDTVIAVEPLSLPPVRFRTKAIWFCVPDETLSEVSANHLDFGGGLHGVEHSLIAVMPFHVMCDRRDIGGFSSPVFPGHGEPMVVIYDGYEGGIGLSENAYLLFEEIMGMTYNLVKSCGCENGCPGCIYSPKCGSDNQPLDKKAALLILREMAGHNIVNTGCPEKQDTGGFLVPAMNSSLR